MQTSRLAHNTRAPRSRCAPIGLNLGLCIVLGLGLTACGDNGDDGTLQFRIYGEHHVEDGLPASAFVDGWTVTFDHFLVSLGPVAATRGHHQVDFQDTTVRLFDLAVPSDGEGHLVTTASLPSGTYDHVDYSLSPVTTETVDGHPIDGDARALMLENGEYLRVVGSATREDRTLQFSWGFPSAALGHHCHTEAPLAAGGQSTIEITIHGDHLFFDDLVEQNPNLAFDRIASADQDMDNVITPQELQAVDITEEDRYGVGNTGITNLWDFIAYQATRMGHVNGEDHCAVTRP